MTKTCWAPGCTSGYRSNDDRNRHFFAVPADKCAQWNQRIPRKGLLTSRHYLCDLHFEEHFICKNYCTIIEGKTVCIPRLRWALTQDAVPTRFPNLPKYLSKRIVARPACKHTFADDGHSAKKALNVKTEHNRNSIQNFNSESGQSAKANSDHCYASTRRKSTPSWRKDGMMIYCIYFNIFLCSALEIWISSVKNTIDIKISLNWNYWEQINE